MSTHTTIIQNLHAKADDVHNDATKLVGNTLGDQAVEALLKGAKAPDGTVTAEWKAYMQNFAETDAQLARLNLQDDKQNQPSVRKSCAYIVSNAICAANSTTVVFEGVVPDIDEGL